MSVCDFGICNNGEALYECFAMHLPVLASDNLSSFDSYQVLYRDSFHTEMNKNCNGEVIPELVGMKFPDKVVELWSEWMVNPEIKFQVIDSVYEELSSFLPLDRSDSFVENRINYVASRKPDDVLADEVMKSVQEYENIVKNYDSGDYHARSGEMRFEILNS